MKTPEDILNANRLIFPGVGAFAAAMDVLNKAGYVLNVIIILMTLLMPESLQQ